MPPHAKQNPRYRYFITKKINAALFYNLDFQHSLTSRACISLLSTHLVTAVLSLMPQADRKEHIHGETGVGAEMHLLKWIHLDTLWWHIRSFTPNLNLNGSSGFWGFRVFSFFCHLKKERKVECRPDLTTKQCQKQSPKSQPSEIFRFLVRKLRFKKKKEKKSFSNF